MPFTGMVGAPGFGNCVTIAALCDMMEKNSRRRLGEDTFYLPWEYMPQSDGRIYHEGTGKARRRCG